MESEGEIEYLDEDAEIVEQLVQAPFTEQASKKKKTKVANTPLLVERRKSERKRKRRKESDDDSDYDPSQDLVVPSSSSKSRMESDYDSDYDPSQDLAVPSSSSRKRKPTSRKSVTKSSVQLLRSYKELPVKTYSKTETVKSVNRKKMDIRIPDYEDPLCLPVKAVKSIGSDLTRLKHWNNACLEHFKHCDTLFKPEKGLTMSSARTILLKNVVHKETARTETTVWSKTCVTNGEGVKKSEIFQCLLPKYREKTVLRAFKLNPYKKKPIHHTNEVILTKEEHKNGEVLIAYMPQETTSAVYKFDEDDKLLSSDEPDNRPESRRVLREIASCKMCAPCFQCSWRGTTKPEKRKLQCPICARTTISMYNLLTHVRAHSPNDVRRHKAQLSAILAAGDLNENLVLGENLNETDTKESNLDQGSTSTPSQHTVDERPSISQREVRRSKSISQQKPIQVSERKQHDPPELQEVKNEIDNELKNLDRVSNRQLDDDDKCNSFGKLIQVRTERRQHDSPELKEVKNEIDKELKNLDRVSQRQLDDDNECNLFGKLIQVSERRQHDPHELKEVKNEIDKELKNLDRISKRQLDDDDKCNPFGKLIQVRTEGRQHDSPELKEVKNEIDKELKNLDRVSKRQLDDDNECNPFGKLIQVSERRQHNLPELNEVKNEIDKELKNLDRISQRQFDDDDECYLFGMLVAMRLQRFSKDRRDQLMIKFLQVVDYHYRCRICNEQLSSIKNLREHVRSHKGTTSFKCEVGNHTTT